MADTAPSTGAGTGTPEHKGIASDLKEIPSWVWLGGALVGGALLFIHWNGSNSAGQVLNQPAPTQIPPSTSGTGDTSGAGTTVDNSGLQAVQSTLTAQGQQLSDLTSAMAQSQQQDQLFQQQTQQQFAQQQSDLIAGLTQEQNALVSGLTAEQSNFNSALAQSQQQNQAALTQLATQENQSQQQLATAFANGLTGLAQQTSASIAQLANSQQTSNQAFAQALASITQQEQSQYNSLEQQIQQMDALFASANRAAFNTPPAPTGTSGYNGYAQNAQGVGTGSQTYPQGQDQHSPGNPGSGQPRAV